MTLPSVQADVKPSEVRVELPSAELEVKAAEVGAEPQSAPGLVFADCIELLHLWLQRI